MLSFCTLLSIDTAEKKLKFLHSFLLLQIFNHWSSSFVLISPLRKETFAMSMCTAWNQELILNIIIFPEWKCAAWGILLAVLSTRHQPDRIAPHRVLTEKTISRRQSGSDFSLHVEKITLISKEVRFMAPFLPHKKTNCFKSVLILFWGLHWCLPKWNKTIPLKFRTGVVKLASMVFIGK